jgi:hypothetical protein
MNEGSSWSYTGLVSGAAVNCDINNEFKLSEIILVGNKLAHSFFYVMFI